MFTITWGTFRFLGISVGNFCPYQKDLSGACFTLINNGRFLSVNNFVLAVRYKKYMCII